MGANLACLLASRSRQSHHWTVRSYWRADIDKALSQQGCRATVGNLQARRDNQAVEARKLAIKQHVNEEGRHAPRNLHIWGVGGCPGAWRAAVTRGYSLMGAQRPCMPKRQRTC